MAIRTRLSTSLAAGSGLLGAAEHVDLVVQPSERLRASVSNLARGSDDSAQWTVVDEFDQLVDLIRQGHKTERDEASRDPYISLTSETSGIGAGLSGDGAGRRGLLDENNPWL